jgi:hypothetical protein
MADYSPKQAQKLEEAMAALTYIAFNWDQDRARAHENLSPLFEHFSMQQVQEGALRALAIIMIQQASDAQMSVTNYINQKVRPQVDFNLRPPKE